MRTNQRARRSIWSQPYICGCYLISPERTRIYLPQVSLKSHSTINAQCFTTNLTQTFYNSSERQIPEIRYTFPLYDGVSVTNYTIRYAGKTLKGVVKQKHQAKQVYQEAVDAGKIASLLEALPAGVFGVTLANVPVDASIVAEITYCGELKHDAAIDGLRYTLPTRIAPRYGDYPGTVLNSNTTAPGGISITVDVDTADAAIRRIQSPSHPIAVSMGELSQASKGGAGSTPYRPSQASATLSLGTAELDSDFVLQMVIDRIGDPQAIIETHPTIPNQRAIMTTLIPKFTLKTGAPEIVFVVDQSGSMSGSKNQALQAALKVFLKSLPLGVRFNICAFGDHFKFLWPKSQAYNEANVEAALEYVDSFEAHFGGTKILEPITATFENRLGDLPLEVMLLSDGEIWNEEALFTYINTQLHENKVDGRVFALGIGSDVSHTLVEGVARAGNGFAQFVTTGDDGSHSYEDLDQKIIRMLKAALYAHTDDYQLEVHYDDAETTEGDDDFELVEKISDCLIIKDDVVPPVDASNAPKSFFDSSVNLDEAAKSPANSDERYAHLPAIETPKILQAPTNIPALFPFNRSTVYLLLGPEASQRAVRSVTLRARSAEGPLELNIPVTSIGTGSTVHQLAARKAIQDLEEGRGWLTVASVGPDRTPVKEKFSSRLDELVEREIVVLGEKFQVASKWTSFVAVEHSLEPIAIPDGSSVAEKSDGQSATSPQVERSMDLDMCLADEDDDLMTSMVIDRQQTSVPGKKKMKKSGNSGSFLSSSAQFLSNAVSSKSSFSGFGFGSSTATGGPSPVMSYSAVPPPPPARSGNLFGTPGTLFGTQQQQQMQMQMQMQPSVPSQPSLGVTRRSRQTSSIFGSAAPPPPSDADPESGMQGFRQKVAEQQPRREFRPPAAPRRQLASQAAPMAFGLTAATAATVAVEEPQDLLGKMRQLIGLQTFSGAWPWSPRLLSLCDLDAANVAPLAFGENETVTATVLVIAFFRARLSAQAGVWEMVVQKARDWLGKNQGLDEGKVEELVQRAVEQYFP